MSVTFNVSSIIRCSYGLPSQDRIYLTRIPGHWSLLFYTHVRIFSELRVNQGQVHLLTQFSKIYVCITVTVVYSHETQIQKDLKTNLDQILS